MLGFFELGLVEEVRTLQAGARPLSTVAAQGIGYREVIAMLAGESDLAETIDRIQTRSRRFAKHRPPGSADWRRSGRSRSSREKTPRRSPTVWYGR